MIVKHLLAFSMLLTTNCTTSCSKKDSSSGGGGTDINATVTLIAGSKTEYGSTDDTDPLKARFFGLTKLVVDTRGGKTALYAIDQSDYWLRVIDETGVRSIPLPIGYAIMNGICLAPGNVAGKILIAAGYGPLLEFDVNQPVNDGTNPKILFERNIQNVNRTGLGGTYGLAVDPKNNNKVLFGNLYYADVATGDLTAKTITPFAGKPLAEQTSQIPAFADGNALDAVFGRVSDIAFTKSGDTVVVADKYYRTVRLIVAGKVKALFKPSPDAFDEQYIQPTVYGSLDKAQSGIIHYLAVPRDNSNLIYFATAGALNVINLAEKRMSRVAQFSEGMDGIACTPDGKEVFVNSGYAIYKVRIGQ